MVLILLLSISLGALPSLGAAATLSAAAGLDTAAAQSDVPEEPVSAIATSDETLTEPANEIVCPEGYLCTPIEPAPEQQDEEPVCHGILTCALFVGGHVIALPFRFLGALFRLLI